MVHYKIYTSFNELPNEWDALAKHDMMLQSAYLQAMEMASPQNIHWFYVGVFNGEKLHGIAIVQRVKLYLRDMFRKTEVSCIKTFLKDLVSRFLKGNLLVVGNLTHTGQHGLFYNKEAISQEAFFQVMVSALDELKVQIKQNENKKIRAIALKDFFKDDSIHKAKHVFDDAHLYQVYVQPNMLLSVREDWHSFSNYISSLNKKYRTRYKRARKKRNAIIPVELALEDIKTQTPRLHKLYMNVSNNAKFNTFILPENHFYSLKLHLKENFRVFGYYLKNELVGFYTLILNNQDLETYFLGYDKAHQYPNQLYLNMLYDMLKFGIENQFKTVVYARTAMEIKSSVGAKAKPMVVYLKHTNPFLNAIFKQVFKLMNPSEDWQVRHPFK